MTSQNIALLIEKTAFYYSKEYDFYTIKMVNCLICCIILKERIYKEEKTPQNISI